jgi:hypothetical protein
VLIEKYRLGANTIIVPLNSTNDRMIGTQKERSTRWWFRRLTMLGSTGGLKGDLLAAETARELAARK